MCILSCCPGYIILFNFRSTKHINYLLVNFLLVNLQNVGLHSLTSNGNSKPNPKKLFIPKDEGCRRKNRGILQNHFTKWLRATRTWQEYWKQTTPLVTQSVCWHRWKSPKQHRMTYMYKLKLIHLFCAYRLITVNLLVKN